MKVLNPYLFELVPAVPDPVSLTVPGQAFTLDELLQRYAAGLPLTDNGCYLYDGDEDPDSLDFDDDEDLSLRPDIDLVDVYEDRERLLARIDVSRRSGDLSEVSGASGVEKGVTSAVDSVGNASVTGVVPED